MEVSIKKGTKKSWRRGASMFTNALTTLFSQFPSNKKIKRVPALPVVTVAMGGGGGVVGGGGNGVLVEAPNNNRNTNAGANRCNGTAPNPENSSTTTPNTPNQQQMASKRHSKDFIFGKVIGEGSFSTVYLTRDIHTNKEYAIKVCEKRHIIREKKTPYVKRERDVLNSISQAGLPFFVKLFCTFQDPERLYFVLTYAKNGELLGYINKVGAFDVKCTRFYAAEILVALEHLHRLNIIHRDLKPENILLDENMHILITDFGSAKVLTPPTTPGSTGEGDGVNEEATSEGEVARRRNSFVGTAQYVSPELLTDKTALPSSDLWALGCIIYQMVSGLPPFRSRSEYAIFQKIIKLEYEFPDGFCPKAKDLVQKLLVLNPRERLGSSDTGGKYMSVRRHRFFGGADWDWEDLTKSTPPTIHPYLGGGTDHEWSAAANQAEPGLDDKQLTRLMGLDLQEAVVYSTPSLATVGKRARNIADLTPAQIEQRLLHQTATSRWHSLVNGNLILKQGLVDKRKGLFPRKRMLLLTMGPHLYYVDPVTMLLKGEIPWSPEIRAEPKNFKIFFVHTPNRTYYLEDPEGYALEWCRVIDEMKAHTYNSSS